MAEISTVVVIDLDGTLYRGAAPFRHYATLIARRMKPDERRRYLAAMDRYVAGDETVAAADGWEAAVVLAGGPVGNSSNFYEAFLETRRFMLEERCQLEIPFGMIEFLELARHSGRLVLASNTPAPYVFPLLHRLGLGSSFDEVCCGAEKPSRFAARLAGWAQIYGLPAKAVLSLGDHFINDIEPALSLGCATAYLDPFGLGPRGRATFEAGDFEQLAEPLSQWLSATAASAVPAGEP